MTEEQRFLFDTFGYIVVRNVVSDAQIQALKETLRQPVEQWDDASDQQGPLHWGEAWRDLLDLPGLSPILEQMIGNGPLLAARQGRAGEREPLPTFRIDHINVHTHIRKGFKGAMLHGDWKATGGSQFFRYHDGRFFNGLVAVAFELYDTHPNGGGFGCIPGTHKANLSLPGRWRDLSKGVHESVTRVPAKPGDAIVFTETLTHGTLPWTVDAPRTTVFYKFSPHGTSWAANFYDPEEFRQYPDMDDRKLAILESPNARYQGRPGRPRRRDE
ncbi:MAG: phytanoyl-CoA dioxygenase family protein [Proteobacteria bacterium]|jgi:ectoine hydroxylase-related dioxygenase (phytanoyl-CoA dioxygenase family)|nr:phytanoyl-CoA dioxygenase family protein [Pseudomonadota bacterium]MDA1299521.1 phytanoyl-CoA dioxygenase family protein [Pseudomonadota bacterium]